MNEYPSHLRQDQQFHKGDHVKVADDLGDFMRHFQSGCEAIVIGSYADQYGGSDRNSYTLHIKGSGPTSWYYGSQLTLIEANRPDLLKQWEDEAEALRKQRSDHDWIFENGPEVLAKGYGASVAALARDVGVTNLWGSHGEGMAYYENSLRVLSIASPYLEKKDKAGWLELSKALRMVTVDYHIR